MFRSITHFESIFYVVLCNSTFSFIYMEKSSLASVTYWKLFLHCIYCLLCLRWIDHTYVGLLLEFLSCSIDLYSCAFFVCLFLCQHHAVLITIAMQYSLESGNLIPLAQFLFLKIFFFLFVFCYLGSFCFHTNCIFVVVVVVILKKKVITNLIVIALSL